MVPMHEPRVLIMLCERVNTHFPVCLEFWGCSLPSIPAVISLVALSRESLRIARLQILSLWRLDIDQGIVTATWSMRRAEAGAVAIGAVGCRGTWAEVFADNIVFRDTVVVQA